MTIWRMAKRRQFKAFPSPRSPRSRHHISEIARRYDRVSGYEDTLRTLRHPEWLERSAIARGVTVHDLHREDAT